MTFRLFSSKLNLSSQCQDDDRKRQICLCGVESHAKVPSGRTWDPLTVNHDRTFFTVAQGKRYGKRTIPSREIQQTQVKEVPLRTRANGVRTLGSCMKSVNEQFRIEALILFDIVYEGTLSRTSDVVNTA